MSNTWSVVIRVQIKTDLTIGQLYELSPMSDHSYSACILSMKKNGRERRVVIDQGFDMQCTDTLNKYLTCNGHIIAIDSGTSERTVVFLDCCDNV